jgi:putative ABC transport system permease protein
VLVALVIPAPIAYFVMNHWLQDFPYRIGVGATVFVIAGFGSPPSPAG